MIKFAIGALLCASAIFPSVVQAGCIKPTSGSTPMSTTATYENVGLYEWHEDLQAWVLVQATYTPYFETEQLVAGDELIAESDFRSYDGAGGGGGGDGGQVVVNSADCDPITLPVVTVTGSAPSFGASLFSLFWRGAGLNAKAGGKSVAKRKVGKIKQHAICPPSGGDEMARETAAWAAYKLEFGISVLRQASQDTERSYKIKFSDGSTGVYQRSSNPDGRASHGLFERMRPSCKGS